MNTDFDEELDRDFEQERNEELGHTQDIYDTDELFEDPDDLPVEDVFQKELEEIDRLLEKQANLDD